MNFILNKIVKVHRIGNETKPDWLEKISTHEKTLKDNDPRYKPENYVIYDEQNDIAFILTRPELYQYYRPEKPFIKLKSGEIKLTPEEYEYIK